MDSNRSIQLGIVDDDRLIVQLLKPLLESDGKIKVCLMAYSGNDFLHQLEREEVELDIILLDLRMDNGNGLEVMTALQKEGKAIKVIVLSTYYRSAFIGQMLKCGAVAFLPKEVDQGELIATIKEVYQRGHYFSPSQFQAIRRQLSSKTPKFYLPQKNGLTAREIEVLKLLCQQFNTQEIATALFISPKTVETHKSNLIFKTGVKNMAGLVIYAIQNRIVDANELILLDR
ncbi:MAG: response regulator transcription factor [Bacteroidota bacterium]